MSSDFGVARFLDNGTLDATYGVNGKTRGCTEADGNCEARALLVDGAGRTVVAGITGENERAFAVARFLSNGGIDSGFAHGGGRTQPFMNGLGRIADIDFDAPIPVANATAVAGTSPSSPSPLSPSVTNPPAGVSSTDRSNA